MRALIILILTIFIPLQKANAVEIKFNCAQTQQGHGSCTKIPIPGIATPFKTYTELKICQVRRVFCGSTGIVFIATAIFLLGIGILNSKISWPVAFITITGIMIFWNADKVAKTFAQTNFIALIENPMCSCDCVVDLFDPKSSELNACLDTLHPIGIILPP